MELKETILARVQNRSDVVVQSIETSGQRCSFLYLAGAVNLDMLQRAVIQPLCETTYPPGAWHNAVYIERSMFSTAYTITADAESAVYALLAGQVVLTVRGSRHALLFPFARKTKRAIDVPQNEKGIRGPKESFVEDIESNLSLIRQRIQSPALKIERMTMGTYTQTVVMLVYIEGLSKPDTVAGLRSELASIQTDKVIASSYLEEMLSKQVYSPFPQVQTTERPDVVAAALLEGRILILVDGTPNPLLLPAPLVVFLQAAEDYYQRYFFSSWVRWIRYLFFALSLVLPSTYVAVTTFHPEMIPFNLLVSVASSREMVPFPAVFEAFMMELTFEVLREAGQRIPTTIGQTISIVGALVIGEAAVQAGIVSAPMVMVVALTGISSFIIPHFALNLAVRILRFMLLLLAGVFGLLGVLVGVFLIYIHLLSLNAFNTPYLTPLVPLKVKGLDDVLARLPWPKMKPGGGPVE